MEIDYNTTNKVLSNGELDNTFYAITSGKETCIYFYHIPTYADVARYSNRAGKHKLEAEYNQERDILTIRCPDRVAINRYYNSTAKVAEGKNRMGCSESWYDPYYAISQTFTADEVDKMDDKELENLIKLAEEIQGALY